MDRNRNLFRQEYIDFLGTGAGMELFSGLPEQEFPLTVLKILQNSCLDCLFQFSPFCKKSWLTKWPIDSSLTFDHSQGK